MFKSFIDQYNNMGLIPPPRSFSDNNGESTATKTNNNFNTVNSLHNSIDSESSYMSDKIDFDDSGDSNYSGHKGTIPVCIIKSTNDGKLALSTEILEEEVPTKVPQLTAMPKKSAMKKPRTEANSTTSNSTNGATTTNSYTNHFRSKTNSSYSKHEATHKVSFPELKSVIKGLKSNPNSVQCK